MSIRYAKFRRVALPPHSELPEIQTPLSPDAFRGLLRLLTSPIPLESNMRHRAGTPDETPLSFGEITPATFLKRLLSKIPATYAPRIYAHGSLSSDKKLAGFAKDAPPKFNDLDIIIFIDRLGYEEAVKNEITTAIYQTYAELTNTPNQQRIAQRGFQKQKLIAPAHNPYAYYGAILTIGPRKGITMLEIKILALGPDPIGNRSLKLAEQCSSSLDSLMVGPLNPLLHFESDSPAIAQGLHGSLSRKGASDFYRALGNNAPQKTSKYFYSDVDLQILETHNIIISPGWSGDLQLTRLAKQAMTQQVRIGSPLVIETIAKRISTLPAADFDEELSRTILVHFPDTASQDKTNYLIVLDNMLSTMATTILARNTPTKLTELKTIVAKHLPKKTKRTESPTQLKMDPLSITISWCGTLSLIVKNASEGRIQQDAITGMDAYLTLLDLAILGQINPDVLPTGNPSATLPEIELKIIRQFKDEPLLYSKILPALSQIHGSLFSPNTPKHTAIPDKTIWLEWAKANDSPVIIPFYDRITEAHPDEEWAITSTRIARISDTIAKSKWMASGLRLVFPLSAISNTWTQVINAVKADKTPALALIEFAPLETPSQARRIATLCPELAPQWLQRIVTDTGISTPIRTAEATIALQELANTPTQNLSWGDLQLTLRLLEHVTEVPETVLSGLTQRMERKFAGSRPQILSINTEHLTRIPNSASFCGTLLTKLHNAKIFSETDLSTLETCTIENIIQKKIPLGPFKSTLKSQLEKETAWQQRLRHLGKEAHYSLLKIASDCGLSREAMTAFILGKELPESLYKEPNIHGLLFKVLETLSSGLDLLVTSDANIPFLKKLGHWAPFFANTPFAEQVFGLMKIPTPGPENCADFNVLCDIAKTLNLLKTPDGPCADQLGRWFTDARPKAAENQHMQIRTQELNTTQTAIVSVSKALQYRFTTMAQEGNFGFVIQCLKHHLAMTHPLQPSEILLRSDELTQSLISIAYKDAPELAQIATLLKSAWTDVIVPFLYKLCVTNQFATGYFEYRYSDGHAKFLPVNITVCLQKVSRSGLISDTDWREINFEMTQQLIQQIHRDELKGTQREHAIALSASIALNTLLPKIGQADLIDHTRITPIVSQLIQMIAEQQQTPENQNTKLVFFAGVIRYFAMHTAPETLSLLDTFVDQHCDTLRHSTFQHALLTQFEGESNIHPLLREHLLRIGKD